MRPALSTELILGQSGLYRETLTTTTKKKACKTDILLNKCKRWAFFIKAVPLAKKKTDMPLIAGIGQLTL